MTCFHCDGTMKCNCVCCDGRCVACANRDRQRVLFAAVDKNRVDIRDARNWITIKPEAPAHPFRRLAIEQALMSAK